MTFPAVRGVPKNLLLGGHAHSPLWLPGFPTCYVFPSGPLDEILGVPYELQLHGTLQDSVFARPMRLNPKEVTFPRYRTLIAQFARWLKRDGRKKGIMK
jgi:hypothetical protein